MLRYMKEGDLEQVCRIEEAVFSRPWSRDSFFSALMNENNVYTVYVDENRLLLAYCGIWGIGQTGEICNIAVAEKARGRGIGRIILDFTLDTCTNRGMKDFTLEVRKSNLAAIRLYEAAGFSVEGVRTAYYTMPKEDALIMWRHSS